MRQRAWLRWWLVPAGVVVLCLALWLAPQSLRLQLAWTQPPSWRWLLTLWTAPLVHWSVWHLALNLAALALLTVLAWRLDAIDAACALALGLAWPLTHLGLVACPAALGSLPAVGGLSGVLHGAAVVVGLQALAAAPNRASRGVAALLLAAVAIKLLGEAGWAPPWVRPHALDVHVVPLVHLSGAAAGLVAWWLVRVVARPWVRRRRVG